MYHLELTPKSYELFDYYFQFTILILLFEEDYTYTHKIKTEIRQINLRQVLMKYFKHVLLVLFFKLGLD
jgi:hypothetical protein